MPGNSPLTGLLTSDSSALAGLLTSGNSALISYGLWYFSVCEASGGGG